MQQQKLVDCCAIHFASAARDRAGCASVCVCVFAECIYALHLNWWIKLSVMMIIRRKCDYGNSSRFPILRIIRQSFRVYRKNKIPLNRTWQIKSSSSPSLRKLLWKLRGEIDKKKNNTLTCTDVLFHPIWKSTTSRQFVLISFILLRIFFYYHQLWKHQFITLCWFDFHKIRDRTIKKSRTISPLNRQTSDVCA